MKYVDSFASTTTPPHSDNVRRCSSTAVEFPIRYDLKHTSPATYTHQRTRTRTPARDTAHHTRGLPRPRTPAAAALYIEAFVFARWRCSPLGLCSALPALVQRETARALHPAGASVASATMRRTRFGRVARARASTIVVLVVPFRAAARFITLLRGDFGCPSLVRISRLGAWAGCAGAPPRPRVRVPRPPRRLGAAAPPRPLAVIANRITPACVPKSWVSQKNRLHYGLPAPDLRGTRFFWEPSTAILEPTTICGGLAPAPRVGTLPPHPRCVFHGSIGLRPLFFLK